MKSTSASALEPGYDVYCQVWDQTGCPDETPICDEEQLPAGVSTQLCKCK